MEICDYKQYQNKSNRQPPIAPGAGIKAIDGMHANLSDSRFC
jgi:hypothetical protein